VQTPGYSGESPPANHRFAFGANWRRFLELVDDERIAMAQESLSAMLHVDDLRGKSFLDVGSGSGLSSLAAARLGAERIHSFDFDIESVACTEVLRNRFYPDMTAWTVEQGDCLDGSYLRKLGRFDVVYAWGVLHHTGDMWRAIEHAADLVAPDGLLFLALYNAQGWISGGWRIVKRTYSSSAFGRWLVTLVFLPLLVTLRLFADLVNRRNPLLRYRRPRARGMSEFRDDIDWLGGFPFEVATPHSVFRCLRKRGFALEELRTTSGWGCNEYVFRRREPG
jgi:2-polyprenyl-6-hydroxyphenyl methylase/3-demethylubiquinone-9 3-methyltransferase